jgi:hypothetical protein
MNSKADDWVRHPTYGDRQVSENRGDKYLIQFVTQGERLMLKHAIESAGQPPFPGFSFGKRKLSGTPQFKVVRAKREPAPDFTHLVKRFLDVFEGGFEAESFDRRERQYKEKAAGLLHGSLGRQQLDELLHNEQFGEVCARASHVVHKTNLIFKQDVKVGKQRPLSNFPTATTTTKYVQLWDTDSRGKFTAPDRSPTTPTCETGAGSGAH